MNNPVHCPNCDKTIIDYISGYSAVYILKCRSCNEQIRIFSAGSTAIVKENLGFRELDKMVRNNKYPDFG